jgi:hypothetical protein
LDAPTLNEEVLGFSNVWYEPAIRHAFTVPCRTDNRSESLSLRSSLERRWKHFGDAATWTPQASHDLEDFVAVIKGRDTLLREIAESPRELRHYLAEAAQMLLAEPRFLDVLPGFVLDSERVPVIQQRLASMAADTFHWNCRPCPGS